MPAPPAPTMTMSYLWILHELLSLSPGPQRMFGSKVKITSVPSTMMNTVAV